MRTHSQPDPTRSIDEQRPEHSALIRTNRLILRPIAAEDEEFITRYLADTELARYLPLERPYKDHEALAWFNGRLAHWQKHTFGTFIITEKESQAPIGYCGIEHVRDTNYKDIRYGLTQQSWGKGYAAEAASALLLYSFMELKIPKIYGAAMTTNRPSIKLLEKLGMTIDTGFNQYGPSVSHYSICRDDFLRNRAQHQTGD